MIKLSKRLEAVARLVTKGRAVCDVGTDHGYLPIWLVQTGVCSRALAMDIHEGPLSRAREHIAACGLAEHIAIRRSDGLQSMRERECDSVVIAGMGGNLIMRILTDGMEKARSVKELILQPQSDIEAVRRFTARLGFAIEEQDMVREDGKYYIMFRCVHSDKGRPKTEKNGTDERTRTACDRYGQQLLLTRHPVLFEYLEKELGVLEKIEQSLSKQGCSEAAVKRLAQIEERRQVIVTARRIMERGTL